MRGASGLLDAVEGHLGYYRVVGVTRMIEPKIGRKIVKDSIIK